MLIVFPEPLVQLDSFTCFLSIHSIIPFFNSLFTWVVSASGPRLPPPTPCPSSYPLRIPQTLQHLHNSMVLSHLLPSACFALPVIPASLIEFLPGYQRCPSSQNQRLYFFPPLFTLTRVMTVPSECSSLDASVGNDSGLVPMSKGLTGQLGGPG